MVKDPPPKIGDEKLVEIARELRPLIIFDSYTRFQPQDETTPQQMARVSEDLRRLTDVGADVLVVYHPDKARSSAYRESTEVFAGVDAAFALSKRKDKHKTIIDTPVSPERLRLTCLDSLDNGGLTLSPPSPTFTP
jgi:hypothetical protein